MGQTYKKTNPALGGIPAQDISYAIPSEGELFWESMDKGRSLNLRKDNKIYNIDYNSLISTYNEGGKAAAAEAAVREQHKDTTFSAGNSVDRMIQGMYNWQSDGLVNPSKYDELDWQGKTAGQWSEQASNQFLSDTGIDPSSVSVGSTPYKSNYFLGDAYRDKALEQGGTLSSEDFRKMYEQQTTASGTQGETAEETEWKRTHPADTYPKLGSEETYADIKKELTQAQSAMDVAGTQNKDLEIGETNWNRLQEQYHPDQLEYATKMVDGKRYWDETKHIEEFKFSKEQEFDIARQRIAEGTGTDTDRANIAYAERTGQLSSKGPAESAINEAERPSQFSSREEGAGGKPIEEKPMEEEKSIDETIFNPKMSSLENMFNFLSPMESVSPLEALDSMGSSEPQSYMPMPQLTQQPANKAMDFAMEYLFTPKERNPINIPVPQMQNPTFNAINPALSAMNIAIPGIPSETEIMQNVLDSPEFQMLSENLGLKQMSAQQQAAAKTNYLDVRFAEDKTNLEQSLAGSGLAFSGIRTTQVRNLMTEVAANKSKITTAMSSKLIDLDVSYKKSVMGLVSDVIKEAKEGREDAIAQLNKAGMAIVGDQIMPTLDAIKEQNDQIIAEAKAALDRGEFQLDQIKTDQAWTTIDLAERKFALEIFKEENKQNIEKAQLELDQAQLMYDTAKTDIELQQAQQTHELAQKEFVMSAIEDENKRLKDTAQYELDVAKFQKDLIQYDLDERKQFFDEYKFEAEQTLDFAQLDKDYYKLDIDERKQLLDEIKEEFVQGKYPMDLEIELAKLEQDFIKLEQAEANINLAYAKEQRLSAGGGTGGTGGGGGTGETEEEATGINAALNDAAGRIMDLEIAGGGSSESYWNLVKEFAKDMKVSEADADRMIINTINAKKGNQSAYNLPTSDFVTRDFVPDTVISSPETAAQMGKTKYESGVMEEYKRRAKEQLKIINGIAYSTQAKAVAKKELASIPKEYAGVTIH